MAITTYSELQAAVADWLDKDNLTTKIPDFIRLAEISTSRWLRTQWVEKIATTVPDSAFVSLPSDYLELRNIQWDYGNQRYVINQVSPRQIDQLYPDNSSGLPVYFSLHDNQIELRPAPASDNSATIRITYYYKPTELSDSNASNEYLVNAPDLLLAGACLEACAYTKDTGGVAYWSARYELLKSQIQGQEESYSWPGEMVMKTA